MIQAIALSGIGGLLTGAVLSALAMGWYKDAIWENAVNEIKIDAANVLIQETDKVNQLERAAQVRVRELEAEHETTIDTIQDLQRSNRALATQRGGLRDPGRRPSRPAPVPATPGETVCPESPADRDAGRLSAELTEYLLIQAALADDMAAYAAAGYQWSVEVDRMFAPPKE